MLFRRGNVSPVVRLLGLIWVSLGVFGCTQQMPEQRVVASATALPTSSPDLTKIVREIEAISTRLGQINQDESGAEERQRLRLERSQKEKELLLLGT